MKYRAAAPAIDGIRITMESALTARDRVGVQDFVLLENYTSEAAFIENLKKRFKENLIYTYIGSVLVSVNPYKELEIYSKQHMERYRGVSFYEAFGNAKTLRNDNSSRFGKYMDVQFDYKGAPVGGHILNYLLEKSRVVHQNHGERNFHIFYQLLEGGEEDLLRRLGLDKNAQNYQYLVKGQCARVSSINDKSDWKNVRKAMSVINFNDDDVEELLSIVASVLHLGNVQFASDEQGNVQVTTENQIKYLARLLSVDSTLLRESLIHKKIIAKGEEFCINYCNEKLQQLFIELTLKSEQDEYESEGIAWEPVQYFNNKIICDLVEEKFKGIISILDEECLRPGDATDMTFLEKLEETVKNHPHFVTHKLGDQKTRKCLGRDEFRLLHYAGEVNYSVVGFLDKNNDLLFRNLKEVMCDSGNPIVHQCFDRSELTDKKRPETAATQFKNSLAKLMEILMSKEPSYVRCIKPNDAKQAARFDEVLIRHQVKYLGLIENVRVRRAGFAYRRKYEFFLQRYKSLCPETWPNWDGRAMDGVAVLVKSLGYKPEEYKMGRTKIFIRFPKTLFATEDALEVRKQSIATFLQSRWRGYHQRQKFLHMKHSAIKIQSWWRGTVDRRKAAKRKWAVSVIRSVLDKSWPVPPPSLREASELLREMCMKNMVWKYCRRISPEWKQQLEQKVVASEIFKDKKDNYPQSVPRLFINTRLGISVSSLSDNLFVIHVKCEDNKQKLFVILESEIVISTTPIRTSRRLLFTNGSLYNRTCLH
ncbi:hypothetical protein GDO78_008773 [Eleutherodactylus coqui]|uniref:Myosin motor domain-containing protein n=1 Tax=Eleutherodactylus coqui TaxID=57060 RepID=A0A8J6KEE9_ELECQ|nr:hypothetical protein GDO78_008773 [Eleutherodactylus coqui]